MKVIDLLNRIANGKEVPEKIQVYSDIFVLDYSNKVYMHEETGTGLLSIYNGNILNYEVKIKEDKKIEKIDVDWQNVFDEQAQQDCVKMILNKINEIIKKINKLETK